MAEVRAIGIGGQSGDRGVILSFEEELNISCDNCGCTLSNWQNFRIPVSKSDGQEGSITKELQTFNRRFIDLDILLFEEIWYYNYHIFGIFLGRRGRCFGQFNWGPMILFSIVLIVIFFHGLILVCNWCFISSISELVVGCFIFRASLFPSSALGTRIRLDLDHLEIFLHVGLVFVL